MKAKFVLVLDFKACPVKVPPVALSGTAWDGVRRTVTVCSAALQVSLAVPLAPCDTQPLAAC